MESNGPRLARAKTTALTKKIDDMLASWEEYDRERLHVCAACLHGNHERCNFKFGSDCGCVCEDDEQFAEWVRTV